MEVKEIVDFFKPRSPLRRDVSIEKKPVLKCIKGDVGKERKSEGPSLAQAEPLQVVD